jgi:hypothetical protein
MGWSRQGCTGFKSSLVLSFKKERLATPSLPFPDFTSSAMIGE